MKLSSLFVKEAMDLNVATTSKTETLVLLADRFAAVGGVSDAAGYVANLENREAQSTTGVGDEIAIPHAQHASIKQAAIVFGRSESGVDWASFDNQPAKLIFMIAAPEGAGGAHLQALASLSKVLLNADAKAALLTAATPDEVVAVIEQFEEPEAATTVEKSAEASVDAPQQDAYVLAVTACPTGIAHTFMAEEKLKQAAARAGVRIKVETNGQTGVGNRLTATDISQATAIIVAADKQVEMARFNGKPVLVTKVADGINKADELVARAVAADAPIYQASSEAVATTTPEKESVGRQFYKHLMNGVSHMLPFVVAGGMLIALSFFWGIESFKEGGPQYNQLAHTFFTIGKLSFSMMLPVLAGFIGQSIADRPGLVLGVIGGILADPSIMTAYPTSNAFGDNLPSGFLGAIVAGFLAGGIITVLKFAFSWLPKSLEGLKPIFLFPVFGAIIIGFLMIYVINAPMAGVMEALKNTLSSMSGTSKLLLGFVAGAMMSIDMGGPINKAAYVTGTGLLTAAGSAGSDVMAAVMVGGMVPPLAIALAATLNKTLWSPEERNGAMVNYVMGAAFITEGAIPFASANPLQVIPTLAVASGLAGALSMAFGSVSYVSHGGIFAVLVGGVTNPLGYLAAWLIGGFAGAFLLSIAFSMFKRNVA